MGVGRTMKIHETLPVFIADQRVANKTASVKNHDTMNRNIGYILMMIRLRTIRDYMRHRVFFIFMIRARQWSFGSFSFPLSHSTKSVWNSNWSNDVVASLLFGSCSSTNHWQDWVSPDFFGSKLDDGLNFSIFTSLYIYIVHTYFVFVYII